ncbi:hypothetical protein LWF15_34670 [Kineosporia rhizophila]|uniref:hypothetical protein n=1 Tax=Kineosporia rhizophila TaxID=84633 RepID=UPI001E455D84|nr:hypothetical protein [Kineosporia rhizophila]MCE0540650.1 hypothetical protein [Kineosporia rhizophila]
MRADVTLTAPETTATADQEPAGSTPAHLADQSFEALLLHRFGSGTDVTPLVLWARSCGLASDILVQVAERAGAPSDVALIIEAVRSGVHFSVTEIAQFFEDDQEEAAAWVFTALLHHRFGDRPSLPDLADALVDSGLDELDLIRNVYEADSPAQVLELVPSSQRSGTPD